MRNGRFHFNILCILIVISIVGSATSQEVKNLAAQGEGGHLVFFSGQYNDSVWKAENLIDGSANDGWAGQNNAPQSVIIAFKDNGLAEVTDVLINPYSREAPSNWVKDIEIQVSTTYPFHDFHSVGKLTLRNEGSDQVFSFPQPIQARYVKVVFLSNYDGSYMEAGEVQIMGRLLSNSPAPKYTNVAAVSKGAKIEKYTSQYNEYDWAVANLLEEDGNNQWAGKSSGSQEVIIALPEVTEISYISINNYSRENSDNWAKDVEVEISSTFSYKGFSPVGKMILPQIGEFHTLSLRKPVAAKYVKVLFRTNHGGAYMEAARIRVYETETATSKPIAQQLRETGRAVVHEIHFGFNSAEILPESVGTLSEIAKTLQDAPKMKLAIEGHTDNVGSADFNLELSRKRAKAVKQWLVDTGGINEARLTTVGYGMTRPIADNNTEAGRAQNRRVELVKKNKGP
ncbi:MAG: discoidin domain-containing protein [bacterium]